MEESGSKKDDIQVRRLSIIDFSSEDDSLLGLPSGFPQENQELRSIELFESVGDDKLVDFDYVTGQKELVPQPSECLEPERVRRNGKYNLRKSLAWDSAFFTCEGVLDAEELSSMTGVVKGEKQLLPGIEEEVHRSTDSISTLESDTLTLESNETSLFEDVRASIQKSSKAAVTADESSKVGSRVRETKTGNALRRVELASQPKMKPKVACKKPSIGMQNPGTLARQVSASPQFSQSSAVSGESTLSLMKRPKGQGKPIPSSTTLAKRASLGGNLLKMEKDTVKTAPGRGAPVSKLPGSSRNVPRPTVSFKSSSVASSTATTTEATSSSFDSSASTTSVKIGKSPSNSMRRKADTRTGNPRSSGSNPKTPSRISSVNKTGPGKSHISSQLMPFSKLSSSISPASSISDWSSESVSSISSLQQISCSSRDSIQSSCKRVSIDFDTPQSLDSENHVDDRSSVGRVTLPPASKPSGLRLPSPKIGFFDGVKSAVRTPKKSVQSHPIVPSNLPKIGAGSGSKTGGQIKAKLGKLNTERAVTNSTKLDAQRTSSNTKPKVSTPQEASKAATRISSALRKVESCHATSPEVKNDTPLKNSSENYLKAEEVGSGGDDIGLHDKDSGLAENNETVVLKAEVTPENKCSAHKEDLNISPITGGQTAISDLSSISNLTNLTLPQEVIEHTKNEELSFMNDLHSSKKINEKERSHFEDQIDCLTRQASAMDIKGTQEMVLSDSFSSQQNLNGEDNVCVPKSSSHRELLVCVQEDSLINLSKPTLCPTTNENTAGKRIPFSVKDSLCNIGESFDVSKGLTLSEGEKNSQLPSSEEQFAEIV
ncbi:hypothetical protein PanWU01x14_089560 [Parasponia andersonii]|uniref:Uncharacterized protein n=1 Tax=Parasponia andersonii TaxID=3476 RepID=A0A2P5D7F3_PARAD|nr:hypothetical protein PanWU01x14_089560 [Parasponia andersonii]